MLYSERDFNIVHATGVKQDYFISCNGAFDPNVTGVGHQPIGFDQMMLFYEHYCVISSRIESRWKSEGKSDAEVGVYLSPDAVASTDVDKAIENGQIKFTNCLGDLGTANYRVPSAASVALACDLTKEFGRSRSAKNLIDDDTMCGTVTANPAEQTYFGLTAWGSPQGTSMNLYVSFVVSYDIIFFEPRKLASS